MIIVTGGAGFIGSNIVKALNLRGEDDIIVVDNLKDGTKFTNIVDCNIADYLSKEDFLERVNSKRHLQKKYVPYFMKGLVVRPRNGMENS